MSFKKRLPCVSRSRLWIQTTKSLISSPICNDLRNQQVYSGWGESLALSYYQNITSKYHNLHALFTSKPSFSANKLKH